MPRHFFFDLDNTLTRSKSHIDPAHVPILLALSERADVIVASGHGAKDIYDHLEDQLKGTYYVLGQNGNSAYEKDGTLIWNNRLSDEQKRACFAFAEKAQNLLKLDVRNPKDLVEDRESQVAYSLIGHHEDKATKEAFDPDHAKRKKLLADMKDDVRELAEKFRIEIRTGGTTVLDMFELGKNKGYNVRALIELKQWRPEECLYIGDALFPGGNDETVIGVIPTHAVKNYQETYERLKQVLNLNGDTVAK